MFILRQKQRVRVAYRVLSAFIMAVFSVTTIIPSGYAQSVSLPTAGTVLNLPVPGTMVGITEGFTPALIKGITIYPDNPLMFDFIVDSGHSEMTGEALKDEASDMIKYFLAALTIPEKDLWVNLSPYEADRIIPDGLGDTSMGRDMLSQDYMLKQLTSSMMYPEDELGGEFWERVYDKAYEKFGNTDIPMNTFNKIWIVPQAAEVYEREKSAFVVGSRLKVMLEEDYVALQKNLGVEQYGLDAMPKSEAKVVSGVTSEVVREVLIPEIEREINEGANFAKLRQIYHAMILSTWYKKRLQESLLGQVYVDQNKTMGVDTQDKQINQKIYDQYVESFKKGVYNYIKEDYNPATQQITPRKYFSGGMNQSMLSRIFKFMDRPTRFEVAPTGFEISYQTSLIDANKDNASIAVRVKEEVESQVDFVLMNSEKEIVSDESMLQDFDPFFLMSLITKWSPKYEDDLKVFHFIRHLYLAWIATKGDLAKATMTLTEKSSFKKFIQDKTLVNKAIEGSLYVNNPNIKGLLKNIRTDITKAENKIKAVRREFVGVNEKSTQETQEAGMITLQNVLLKNKSAGKTGEEDVFGISISRFPSDQYGEFEANFIQKDGNTVQIIAWQENKIIDVDYNQTMENFYKDHNLFYRNNKKGIPTVIIEEKYGKNRKIYKITRGEGQEVMKQKDFKELVWNDTAMVTDKESQAAKKILFDFRESEANRMNTARIRRVHVLMNAMRIRYAIGKDEGSSVVGIFYDMEKAFLKKQSNFKHSDAILFYHTVLALDLPDEEYVTLKNSVMQSLFRLAERIMKEEGIVISVKEILAQKEKIKMAMINVLPHMKHFKHMEWGVYDYIDRVLSSSDKKWDEVYYYKYKVAISLGESYSKLGHSFEGVFAKIKGKIASFRANDYVDVFRQLNKKYTADALYQGLPYTVDGVRIFKSRLKQYRQDFRSAMDTHYKNIFKLALKGELEDSPYDIYENEGSSLQNQAGAQLSTEELIYLNGIAAGNESFWLEAWRMRNAFQNSPDEVERLIILEDVFNGKSIELGLLKIEKDEKKKDKEKIAILEVEMKSIEETIDLLLEKKQEILSEVEYVAEDENEQNLAMLVGLNQKIDQWLQGLEKDEDAAMAAFKSLLLKIKQKITGISNRKKIVVEDIPGLETLGVSMENFLNAEGIHTPKDAAKLGKSINETINRAIKAFRKRGSVDFTEDNLFALLLKKYDENVPINRDDLMKDLEKFSLGVYSNSVEFGLIKLQLQMKVFLNRNVEWFLSPMHHFPQAVARASQDNNIGRTIEMLGEISTYLDDGVTFAGNAASRIFKKYKYIDENNYEEMADEYAQVVRSLQDHIKQIADEDHEEFQEMIDILNASIQQQLEDVLGGIAEAKVPYVEERGGKRFSIGIPYDLRDSFAKNVVSIYERHTDWMNILKVSLKGTYRDLKIKIDEVREMEKKFINDYFNVRPNSNLLKEEEKEIYIPRVEEFYEKLAEFEGVKMPSKEKRWITGWILKLEGIYKGLGGADKVIDRVNVKTIGDGMDTWDDLPDFDQITAELDDSMMATTLAELLEKLKMSKDEVDKKAVTKQIFRLVDEDLDEPLKGRFLKQFTELNGETDKASITPIGGINFDSAMLNLQIKRDGAGVPLPLIEQDMDLGMRVQGFLPIIINATPVSLPQLLGFSDTVPQEADSSTMSLSYHILTRDPQDIII